MVILIEPPKGLRFLRTTMQQARFSVAFRERHLLKRFDKRSLSVLNCGTLFPPRLKPGAKSSRLKGANKAHFLSFLEDPRFEELVQRRRIHLSDS